MARKFLYAITLGVLLVIATLLGLRFWAKELSQFAFVPTTRFQAPPPLAKNAYASDKLWISRGGKAPNDPARWVPRGTLAAPAKIPVSVFFVHPTSFFERGRWNAPVSDAQTSQRAELFVRGFASPFGAATGIWAPRYRQATFGAFLTDSANGPHSLDAAYGDVLAAFDQFLAEADAKAPIVLVGHSQGALHLMRLMRDRVAGTPLARRIAAAYVIGWPVSLRHDLPAMGLTACTDADQPGCVLSWQSYAEPADTAMTLDAYGRYLGLDGQNRKGSAFLCTNPLTGVEGGEAPASANLGSLVPDATLTGGSLVPGMVPARCGDKGFLLIGKPPEMGPYVLPGNNYHIYDIPLFWANIRADFARRVAAWQKSGG